MRSVNSLEEHVSGCRAGPPIRAETDIILSYRRAPLVLVAAALVLQGGAAGAIYASRRTAGEIDAIDTGTLSVSATFPLPANVCPSSLALSSSLVWFSYRCDDSHVGICSLDPSNGSTQLFPNTPSIFHVD